MNPKSFLAVIISLAVGTTPIASAAPSAEAERLVASWVALWSSYDLDRVDDLFLQDIE